MVGPGNLRDTGPPARSTDKASDLEGTKSQKLFGLCAKYASNFKLLIGSYKSGVCVCVCALRTPNRIRVCFSAAYAAAVQILIPLTPVVKVVIGRGRLYNGCLRVEQIGLTAQQGDLNQTRGLIPPSSISTSTTD